MTTLKPMTTRVRVCSFLLAVLTSTLVLGGTVALMDSGNDAAGPAAASMTAQAAAQPARAVN